MAYKLVETESALLDLDEILKYLAVDLANPTAAASFADEVEKCYGYLEQTPQLYELCRGPQLRALGYHKAVLKRYIMVYKIDEARKTVHILRFFHGKRDYEKLL